MEHLKNTFVQEKKKVELYANKQDILYIFKKFVRIEFKKEFILCRANCKIEEVFILLFYIWKGRNNNLLWVCII